MLFLKNNIKNNIADTSTLLYLIYLNIIHHPIIRALETNRACNENWLERKPRTM